MSKAMPAAPVENIQALLTDPTNADAVPPRLPNLFDLPIAVVTGDTSPFAPAGTLIVAALKAAGAAAGLLHLPDHSVTGDGNGPMYERNSDAALVPALAWLERLGDARPGAK